MLTVKGPPPIVPDVLPPRLWPLLPASDGCCAVSGSARLPRDPLRGSRALAALLPAASSAASIGASYAKRDAVWLACSPTPPAAADCTGRVHWLGSRLSSWPVCFTAMLEAAVLINEVAANSA